MKGKFLRSGGGEIPCELQPKQELPCHKLLRFLQFQKSLHQPTCNESKNKNKQASSLALYPQKCQRKVKSRKTSSQDKTESAK